MNTPQSDDSDSGKLLEMGAAPKMLAKIELKSSVSELALTHIDNQNPKIEWLKNLIENYDFNPQGFIDRVLVWYAEIMNPLTIQHLSGKHKSDVSRKIDTSVARLVFPEGTLAEWFEWNVWKIESDICLLRDKSNLEWISEEQKVALESIISRFRFWIHQLHSLIWSAYKWRRQEELNKAIWITNKLLADIQLELASLLYKSGITEVLHSHYEQRINQDLFAQAFARHWIDDPYEFLMRPENQNSRIDTTPRIDWVPVVPIADIDEICARLKHV